MILIAFSLCWSTNKIDTENQYTHEIIFIAKMMMVVFTYQIIFYFIFIVKRVF